MMDTLVKSRLLTSHRQLNHGSPLNVVAGEGTANLESLVAHYEAKRKEAEEARAAKS